MNAACLRAGRDPKEVTLISVNTDETDLLIVDGGL